MRTSTRLILWVLVILLVSPAGLSVDRRGREDLIAALVNASLRTIYSDDGAADATVTAVATEDTFRKDAAPQVRAILDLGPSCLSLLIAHLDDQRMTRATFNGTHFHRKPIRVPIGHVCLDILLNATAAKAVHIEDCADDGLRACTREGYYFRPDILHRRSGVATMREVKAAWQRAYRAKQLRFEYPAWLERT